MPHEIMPDNAWTLIHLILLVHFRTNHFLLFALWSTLPKFNRLVVTHTLKETVSTLPKINRLGVRHIHIETISTLPKLNRLVVRHILIEAVSTLPKLSRLLVWHILIEGVSTLPAIEIEFYLAGLRGGTPCGIGEGGEESNPQEKLNIIWGLRQVHARGRGRGLGAKLLKKREKAWGGKGPNKNFKLHIDLNYISINQYNNIRIFGNNASHGIKFQ